MLICHEGGNLDVSCRVKSRPTRIMAETYHRVDRYTVVTLENFDNVFHSRQVSFCTRLCLDFTAAISLCDSHVSADG